MTLTLASLESKVQEKNYYKRCFLFEKELILCFKTSFFNLFEAE